MKIKISLDMDKVNTLKEEWRIAREEAKKARNARNIIRLNLHKEIVADVKFLMNENHMKKNVAAKLVADAYGISLKQVFSIERNLYKNGLLG